MTDRPTASTINDAQLDQLYDDLAAARAALVRNDQPAGTRWLHIDLTSPHETTANTSALALADHLRAEFPGVGMRISSNAVETESVIVCTTACDEQHTYDWTCEQFAGTEPEAAPSCSPGAGETEPNNTTRVTALYEQWVKAGAPPLGVPMSRWWDRRLVELRDAIHTPAEQPRTTPNNPAGA